MADDLSGKVALVTGGAVRIGRAITLGLAAAGCNVFIHYGHSKEEVKQTEADAAAHGVRAVSYAADLRDAAAAEQIIPAAVDAFGKLDILVNNAAIFLEGDLASTTREMWESQFDINLRAPFLLSQAFARQVPVGGTGNILNITDARIFRTGTDHFAYRLTKAALTTMTEMLALALAPQIRVNALALGAILAPAEKDEHYLQDLVQGQVPLRQAGDVESVVQNALHLLRQPFVTGVTLKLDGGQFL